ncbi:MAG: 4Fe-4S binding protein [Fusobacteriaceae bacterium]|nr:4Fe-4S binding protein [Fusobacteriaceae bacterium]
MYIIDKSECIECGFCKRICPKNSIKKAEYAYEITDTCVSCGLCAKNCPVKAITKKEE